MKYNTHQLNSLAMCEVVEKLGHETRKSGAYHVMLCPFHDDHHPSMVVKEHYARCYVCNRGFNVIDFVKEDRNITFLEACEWLYAEFGVGREYTSDTVRVRKSTPAITRLHARKPSPVQTVRHEWAFTLEYVAEHVSMQDSFCKCLASFFDKEKIRYVAEMYGIGCLGLDDTMFPVIDSALNVHNIKIQHYDTDPHSAGFFHKDRNAWWYGKKYIETHQCSESACYDVQCFFGEHLISYYPSSIIILVESPKNAILGTCAWPEYVWVAAGNKNMLTRQRMECLRGRKVIVMPDADAEEEWRTILNGMQDIATFIFSYMIPSFRAMGNKCDIGDWIVREMATYIKKC